MIQVTAEQKDKFEEAMRDDNRKLAYRIKIDDKVVLLNQLKSQMVITTDGGFEEYHVGYALTSSLEFYTKKEFEMTSCAMHFPPTSMRSPLKQTAVCATAGATYGASAMMANLLEGLDLPPASRIAVQVEKSVESAILYLATLRAVMCICH